MLNEEVKQLIDDTIKMDGMGGVSTYPLIDGSLMSNYVPFRKYFREYEWTDEMSEYVKSLFEE